MSVEELLLSDRDHLYQQSVGIRRAAQARLRQEMEVLEAEFRYETLGLAVPREAQRFPLEFQRKHDEDILFYLKFPYLFYELYSQVPLKQYDQLAISQYLYLSHVLMFDHLMDGKLLLEPQIAYWTNSAYQRIVSILSNLFPAASPFWTYFEKCRIENVQALTLERVRHTYLVSEYSDQEKIFIFSGKSSMAKAGLAALAYLSQQDISDAVALSCEAFHVGLQLIDNLQDWRSDYRDHLYTPLLTQVLLANHLANEAESGQRIDVNKIGSLIYGQGHALETLKDATNTFQLALLAVKDVKCLVWQNEILGMIQGCEQHETALLQKLHDLQAKRKRQAPSLAPAPEAKAVEPQHSLCLITPEQPPSADWVTCLRQAVNVDQSIFYECARLEGDISVFSLIVDETLTRCEAEIPAPDGLQVYLCNIPHLPASICFEYGQKWQIVLNQPSFSHSLVALKEHLAYQYGNMSRLRHAPKPESCLDTMCVKGFGLIMIKKLSLETKQPTLLPKGLGWFERNKHYLWQEVQPYLASPSLTGFTHSLKFDQLESLLSYDLIASYCERMGNDALRQGVRTSTEEILNKSTALAIASRVSGAKNVRFDI